MKVIGAFLGLLFLVAFAVFILTQVGDTAASAGLADDQQAMLNAFPLMITVLGVFAGVGAILVLARLKT